MSLILVIGNKNYSSWSLRAWLAMELTGSPYDEVRIPLYQADSHKRLLAYSPTAKVPVLQSEDGTVWDSLAIAEYLAERFPEAHLHDYGKAPRPGRKVGHVTLRAASEGAFFERLPEWERAFDRECVP